MFQIGRGNYRAQHGIHYVAHIWNTNDISLLCQFDILRRYRFTYRNTLRPLRGIWIVMGNTTQTIHSYPYHNIQYITETAYIHIHIGIENIHALANARFSSGKHPYIYMPIIQLWLGAIFARRHHRCQLSTVRSTYNSACLEKYINGSLIYTSWTHGDPSTFPFNTCSLNAASSV